MKSMAVTLSSLALVACGGGGGGGSTAAPAALPAASAALSTTNQSVAAQEAGSSAFLLVSSGQPLTGAQVTDERALFGFARSYLDNLPVYLADAKANSTLVGAASSATVNCSQGGSMSVSGTDADNNGVVSAGDSVTFTSNNCQMPMGTITGSFTFAVTKLSGSFSSTSSDLEVTMSYNAFTVTAAQYSATLNGSLSMHQTNSGTNTYTETISTPSFAVSATYSGVTRSRTLSSYSASVTKSPDATYGYLRSYSVAGTVTSSGLSTQSVTFSTPTPLVTQGTDAYPSTGVFLVTGANHSQIKLTALSNTQATIELDANGDGTFESSSTVAWNTIL